MSAICSIYQPSGHTLPPALGETLMEELRRFPANAVHAWQQRHVFLGCHAQWITPESTAELLPHFDSGLQLAITADAIIDNREELFEKLNIPRGERSGMPDSMLILQAYAKWGEASPQYLVGDFAYIIWDGRSGTLFGARDFSGNRTLYYAETSQFVAFCTAIRPLFALPGVERGLDEQWISGFLAIPMTTDSIDDSSTVYRQIRQLPPSHCFTAKGGAIRFRRYCSLGDEGKLRLGSDDEYVEAFRDVFRTAVDSRLRTFREVGANLSGGLDSGSVVSFAAPSLKRQGKTLHTYSYVPLPDFEDWTARSRVANEMPNIKETVAYVGNINDRYFDFPELSPLSEVDDWLDMLEMPYKFFENSYWLKGIYQQAQQANVGVLLTGARGNWTVSWGPALDYHAALLRQLKLLKLYKEISRFSANAGMNKKRMYPLLCRRAFPEVAGLLSRRRPEETPKLIHPGFAERTGIFQRMEEQQYDFWGVAGQSVYEVKRKQFEKLYFWAMTGVVGCKQSLRHGLWERDATNDLRVVRFCLSLPEEQFVQNGYDRSLIRRATQGRLPDSIRLNLKVRGIQGADGIQRIKPAWPQLMSEFRQTIDDSEVADFLNMEALRQALASLSGEPKPELVYDLNFRMLMRSLIFRRFIKKYA